MPEKCTDPLFLPCPGAQAPCLGSCMFQVCARYDAIAGSTNVQNLRVTFEGGTHAPPLVASPADVEAAASACRENFNRGRGFVQYRDANGNNHELNSGNFDREWTAVQRRRTPAQRQEEQRIRAKGHCSNWTQAEIDWMIANVMPRSVDGWNITWRCQGAEPGSGLSVTELSTQDQIQFFWVDFSIDVTCVCPGAPANTGVLRANLRGP